MSLVQVQDYVILFDNDTSIASVTTITSVLSYTDQLQDNITTLSTNYAMTVGNYIQGLLYVPDLDDDEICNQIVGDYIPSNVTRQANLPRTSYNLIALAPWINDNCTRAFLNGARQDPIRAFVFYFPNGTEDKPPPADDVAWQLDDDGRWKNKYHFPVYAVSTSHGSRMLHQSSLYSGTLSDTPNATNIISTYQPDSSDYVRVWTSLQVKTERGYKGMAFFIGVTILVTIVVIGGTSLLMHFLQNRRRTAIRQLVKDGHLNLEATGIKRVQVPETHVRTFPLFTYNHEPPPSPLGSPATLMGVSSPSGTQRMSSDRLSPIFESEKDINPIHYQPTCQICEENFVSKVSIIRELSCGHIFHHCCIDEFLTQYSSLCPLCKALMLPPRYCPKITNGMVRRIRSKRDLGVIVFPSISGASWNFKSRLWGSRGRSSSAGKRQRHRPSLSANPPLQDQSSLELMEQGDANRNADLQQTSQLQRLDTAMSRQQQMERFVEIDENISDDGRARWRQAVSRAFPGF